MKRLFSKITIGETVLNFVNDIEIKSSWQELTDTAKITFPQRVTKDGENIFTGSNPLFKRGQRVEIQLGYFPTLTTVFVGYVARIEPTTPLTIYCEDSMFLLKQKPKNLSFKSVDLKTLIGSFAAGVPFEAVEADLGQFRITNATGAQVLEELRKTYKLDVFFKDETLFAGLRRVPKLSKAHEILIEKHVVDNRLEWRNSDDVKIKLKAVSMFPDNSKIEIEVGDVDGETRTGYFYKLDEKTLRDTAEREIEKFKFTGFRGALEMFGEPIVSHGDTLKIVSFKYPEKNGEYFIDSVTTSFGLYGFRQVVELGMKSE